MKGKEESKSKGEKIFFAFGDFSNFKNKNNSFSLVCEMLLNMLSLINTYLL